MHVPVSAAYHRTKGLPLFTDCPITLTVGPRNKMLFSIELTPGSKVMNWPIIDIPLTR